MGSAFDQTDKASFLDDFGGIWSLGMEMLQHEKNGNNYRKNKNITYYTNCDAWSINFTVIFKIYIDLFVFAVFR